MNRANQAGAWRAGGRRPCSPPSSTPGRALTGGPGRAAGKCRRSPLPPSASGVGRTPGAPQDREHRSTGGAWRGEEGVLARWSPEAAPARLAARVSLAGRGGGRRGALAAAVSTCARRPPGVRTPHADGRTAGAGCRGGGAARTWGRAHPGPPACHGCGAALAPGRGTPGRDPSPRLLRGPEVNPGGPGAGRALLMAFPGADPRLGSGFPRPAALSPTRCLAPVTRDRASRANSGCPGALHGPGTPPRFASRIPTLPSPHLRGHLLGPLQRLQWVPASQGCCFLGVCQGVGRVGWFQGSPHRHPSQSQARTRKACVSSWPVTAASSESDLLVPFLVLFCLLKRESKNFSGPSRHGLKS